MADEVLSQQTSHEFDAVANLDCKCMDAHTRKVILFCINERLKTLRTFPRGMVDGLEYDLLELKQQVMDCSMKRKPKKEDGKA